MAGSALAGRLLAPSLNVRVERYMQVRPPCTGSPPTCWSVVLFSTVAIRFFYSTSICHYWRAGCRICMGWILAERGMVVQPSGCAARLHIHSAGAGLTEALLEGLPHVNVPAQVVFAVSALALFVPVIFNQTAHEEHEALEDAPGAPLLPLCA